MERIGEHGKLTGSSMLAHEVRENFGVQIPGSSVREAHNDGIAAENRLHYPYSKVYGQDDDMLRNVGVHEYIVPLTNTTMKQVTNIGIIYMMGNVSTATNNQR
jgi:hypothetical protein